MSDSTQNKTAPKGADHSADKTAAPKATGKTADKAAHKANDQVTGQIESPKAEKKQTSKVAKVAVAAPKSHKAPAKKAVVAEPVSNKKFTVKLIRGLSGVSNTQILTLAALGLRRREKSVVVADNAANRGQIMKVQHLVTVVVAK